MMLSVISACAYICFALTIRGHVIAYPEGKCLKLTLLVITHFKLTMKLNNVAMLSTIATFLFILLGISNSFYIY